MKNDADIHVLERESVNELTAAEENDILRSQNKDMERGQRNDLRYDNLRRNNIEIR